MKRRRVEAVSRPAVPTASLVPPLLLPPFFFRLIYVRLSLFRLSFFFRLDRRPLPGNPAGKPLE